VTLTLVRLLLVFVGIALLAPALAADDRVDRLTEEHKNWLEQEVIYIISEREREAFLGLDTRDEQNRFIEAFWRKRDPNRTTPENEYKTEHYLRIEYANTYLGRETYLNGWQTDRGRYYIILGEPREVQRYEGYGSIVSTHLWFYQGEVGKGLPAFFYLLFFKHNDFGEYRLYSPAIDGPQALLTGTSNTDNLRAFEILNDISPQLSAASLSFDTAEPPDLISFQPSMGTDFIMARIEESPSRAIRTDYLDAARRYGNRVSAEYTFNYVPSRSTFAVLADRSGMGLVQYSIEIDPENFSTESDEDQTKFYTTLDLTIEARAADGTIVVENDKEAYLELSASRMRQVQSQPFAYQDLFPLVAGDYQVSVILRNRVLRRYTVAEAEIHVPRFEVGKPELADIVAGFDTEIIADARADAMSTFQIGSLRVYPAADNLFVIGETIYLVTQAVGTSAGQEVVFELLSGDEVLESIPSDIEAGGIVSARMSLTGLVGGNYAVRARLMSADGEMLSERTAPVTVSPRSVSRRPGFVYRRGFDAQGPGVLSAIKGEQLWNLKRYEESRIALEEAIAVNPRHVPARVMLATIYLRMGDADQTLELLKPLEELLPDQYEVVSGRGLAHYLRGSYETAIADLEHARTLRPAGILLLNALADSYERLANLDKAREIYERSLALELEQPQVRERLSALGGASP